MVAKTQLRVTVWRVDSISGGPAQPDPASQDPGSADPGSADSGSADPGSADPGSADPGSALGPWGPLTLPPARRLPAPGECQLWSVPTTDLPGYLDLLDPGEQARAQRFRVADARAIFVASRAAQRLILGRYLDRPPEHVRISRDCRLCQKDHEGRPYLDGAPLDFSVSHTAGWLLVAVVAAGRIGVDIEVVSEARASDALARQVLGPAEQERFLLVARDERPAAFIRAWCRKEAVVKLTGHGIAAPLRTLDVTGPSAEISPPPAGWPAEPIYLHDLPARQELRAALASTVPISQVTHCGPVPVPWSPAGNAARAR
jgi:4'-phosphopantetheinyl transferase